MAHKLAVFVGDQRHRQGVVSAKPFDDPTLSLVAVRMIGECGGDDLIDLVFIAGSFVAARHGLWASLCIKCPTSISLSLSFPKHVC
jgi:hypothetical protein